MKLEQQVCSLEYAKRLKELGVKQESIFVWEYYNEEFYGVNFLPLAIIPNNFDNFENYSAFTVAELCEILPAKHLNFYKNESGYIFSLFGEPNTIDKNIANAAAKMLIQLLENGMIENEI